MFLYNQTVSLATPPKDEPSSTLVPMMIKVVAAAMVGTALVVGNAYGFSHYPAWIFYAISAIIPSFILICSCTLIWTKCVVRSTGKKEL